MGESLLPLGAVVAKPAILVRVNRIDTGLVAHGIATVFMIKIVTNFYYFLFEWFYQRVSVIVFFFNMEHVYKYYFVAFFI